MKIYQVEELVGITKKNIRFYEDQGLLCPKRNPEIDYREYSLEDVRVLEKIKLLRKLSVPIEEIRLLLNNKLSFSQVMNLQIERIEKEQKNAEVMKELCARLQNETLDIKSLDASKYLMEMTKMEMEGTNFIDIKKQDINRKKKGGAIAGASIFCLMLILALSLFVYLFVSGATPILPVIAPIAVIMCALIGTIIMLVQRIREINKGEEFEAMKY